MPKRGMTQKPCPGCGEAGWRGTNEVCSDCLGLMADGKKWREAIAKKEAEGESEVYSLPYKFRINYFEVREHGRAASVRLGAAMAQVAKLVSEPCAWQYGRSVARLLITNPGRASDSDLESFRINPAMAAALQELDQAIRSALNETAATSEKKGSNLLLQLAAGKITADEINDASIGKR